MRRLLQSGSATNIDVEAEDGFQALRTAEDWWTIALGSGLRWAIDQMGPQTAAGMHADNVNWLRENKIDRLETNPRFAAISRPANAAILVRLRIDMEDRGGNVELLLPYATIEPIRSVLLQMFMGEKFGRDPIWEGHFATEIAQAEIAVDAVLYESDIPLKQLMKLKVGDTLPLEMRADALVSVRCGSVTLTEGRMGRVGDRVAIRVTKPLRKPRTTLAMFEKADEQNKMLEAQ